jgi:hypothetical protein
LACRWDLANKWKTATITVFFRRAMSRRAAWNPRPAFYYMTFFQRFCGDHLVNAKVTVRFYPSARHAFPPVRRGYFGQ